MNIKNYAHHSHKQRLNFTETLAKQADLKDGFRPVEDVVEGLSFGEILKTARPEEFRVTSTDRVNVGSDALLLNMGDKLPSALLNMTWKAVGRWVTHGSKAPEMLKEPFQAGREVPLKFEELTESLESVINEFPEFEPHLGEEHVWSPKSKSHRGWGYWRRVVSALKGERQLPPPTYGASKLLSALGLGATAAVLPTGKEEPLKEWVLSQEDGSVEVHGLFKKSYQLNEGDLYSTLLTAENILSEGLYTPDRQDRPVTRKLSYLRNDSAPHGDNFGGWYHLFGSALFSLMRPEWKARVSMKIESAGSLILEGRDPQEDHINELGVDLGQALKKIATTGTDREARVRDYVHRTEFGWKQEGMNTWSSKS